MERDFLGCTVKREAPDETTDHSGPMRSSAMQWSFSSNVSARPQVLSFQGTQETKLKTGFDSLASTGLVTITTAEAADSNLKAYPGFGQKNIAREKQGGVYTMTNYPAPHLNTHTVTLATSTPVHQSFISTAGQNIIGSSIPQRPSGISVQTTTPIVPSGSSVVGTTALRNSSRPSGTPSQLTIFYSGSVCVYDNVSPEKAQAIMLLAGNGPPVTASTILPTASVQAPMPRSFSTDGFAVNQPYGTSHRSTSLAVTTVSASQSAGEPGNDNNVMVGKPAGVLTSAPGQVEPLKIANPIRAVPATFLSPDAVPQARKKSLARFLEKRKERVVNVSPYYNTESPDRTPGSGSTISATSSGSCPVPPIH